MASSADPFLRFVEPRDWSAGAEPADAPRPSHQEVEEKKTRSILLTLKQCDRWGVLVPKEDPARVHKQEEG